MHRNKVLVKYLTTDGLREDAGEVIVSADLMRLKLLLDNAVLYPKILDLDVTSASSEPRPLCNVQRR